MRQIEIYNPHDILKYRTGNHIVQRLRDSLDPDRIVKIPEWKEIDLYDYVKDVLGGKVYDESIRDNMIYLRPQDEHMTTKLAKSKKRKSLGYKVNHPALDVLHEFYHDSAHEGAAKNDLFLDITKNRVYGFIILNVHSADIDIKVPKYSDPGHFIIRYNENVSNTKIGWQVRCEYISRIFNNMGFDSEISGGYVHLEKNPESVEGLEDSIAKAMRGLVSTTHLNLAFEIFPEKLDDAVKNFNDGTTNIFETLGGDRIYSYFENY